MKRIALIVFLFALATLPSYAQDISGDWQGTLNTGKGLRVILKIAKTEAGGWKATLYSIDQTPNGLPVSSIVLHDFDLEFSVDPIGAHYEGKIDKDGQSISGTFTQGQSFPLVLKHATAETAWKIDFSPHKTLFIPVETDVKLEVLDWGGTGRPLVLLAGLGNDAHVFDSFALKLTPRYHVYGITRRGFGASSAPAPTSENYAADRLGDDVLAVIDVLKLDRPVLAGHSIAGEELSSIGSRHPEKVAGLIYLDAGYPYAFYDPVHGDLTLDSVDLKRKLDLFVSAKILDPKQFFPELQASLLQVGKDVAEAQKKLALSPPPPARGADPPPIPVAVRAGIQKYTEIHGPVLAIYAVPHDLSEVFRNDEAARKAAVAFDLSATSSQADAFAAGVPNARVVRLPNADHYIFRSNEADVLREMNAFIATLP